MGRYLKKRGEKSNHSLLNGGRGAFFFLAMIYEAFIFLVSLVVSVCNEYSFFWFLEKIWFILRGERNVVGGGGEKRIKKKKKPPAFWFFVKTMVLTIYGLREKRNIKRRGGTSPHGTEKKQVEQAGVHPRNKQSKKERAKSKNEKSLYSDVFFFAYFYFS